AGLASALSRAYARGLKSGGVLGVMKHFPGHGATVEDSHVMLPVVERSAAELHAIDLLPYKEAIAASELDAVMIGHLHVPAFDHAAPTTLSRPIITGLLRDGLGFDGLVMTDELKMRAISAYWGVEEAALLTLQAGTDIILADWTGAEQDQVFNSLVRACHAGQLSPGRLELSVTRILTVKLRYGLVADSLRARYDALVRTLSAPPADETLAPGDAGEPMAEGEMPAEGEPMVEGEPPAGEDAVPTPTAVPTPLPTPLSTQPTPVSIQPTPTPLPTATATRTRTPSPTATRTATAAATATRAP
ncbi:MAG TPA: glycoside hydrolase family 3 N-terminal domain-containing protein, partial [Chloroflexota bacterium]|nr:glycoside hydrolase family 3 N-terminal domain-containing protein [Chloroflexota bacterium]